MNKIFSSPKNLIFWSLIVLLIIGCLVFIYFIWQYVFLTSRVTIPLGFLSSYQKVAKTSQDIVNFTNSARQIIKEVNSADLNANGERALSLINQARQKNNQAHDLAFELSQNLKNMAESLNQLKTLESQRLGYEAVALEFSLVSEFIAYSQSTNNFLDSLTLAIAVDNFQNRHRVSEVLKNVNQKVLLINSLNREYLNKIILLGRSLNK